MLELGRSRCSGMLAGFLIAAILIATTLSSPERAALAAGAPRACRAAIDLPFSEATRAANEGAGFADRHEGYGVKSWVLYESPDPLKAEPNRAGVDAIIVETPFERIRNESYLLRYQGEALSRAGIMRMRHEASGTIGLIVYAHSRGANDRGFMGAYSRAVITLSDHRRLVSNDAVRFGPSSDFYSVGTFRDTRWTGSLTYRFPLPSTLNAAPCKLAGTLRFSDGHGRSYAQAFRLANYR